MTGSVDRGFNVGSVKVDATRGIVELSRRTENVPQERAHLILYTNTISDKSRKVISAHNCINVETRIDPRSLRQHFIEDSARCVVVIEVVVI